MSVSIDSRIRTRDGLGLAIYRWLPAGEPIGSVLILHGLGEHAARFQEVAEAIVTTGLSVVSFDLRGHGHSEGPRGHAPSYDALLDDIAIVFHSASMSVDGPKFIYGQSMGGNLALGYLARRGKQDDDVQQTEDVAGAVVTSPLILPAANPPAWKRAMGRLVNVVYPRFSFDNGVDANELSHDHEVCRQYQSDPLVFSSITARLAVSVLDRGSEMLVDPPVLDCPLLLMHGSDDRVTSPQASERLATMIGSACQFKLWTGMKHELHHETCRQQVMDEIVGWIRSRALTLRSGQDYQTN